MESDLNQEPLDLPHGSMLGLECLLNELENTHGRIEERIRQLKAVISRNRQRQIWRQSQITPQTVNGDIFGFQNDDTLVSEGIVIPIQERIFAATEVVKRNNISLIAKALGAETNATKFRRDHWCFFDCYICLDMATEPILTCCGHLFCWPCFYTWPYDHSNVKECPVCMEKVADTSIIPIYGNGNVKNTRNSRLKELGIEVPPRPHAHRIESLRQELGNHRPISSPIGRNAQQLSMIATADERSQSQDHDGAPFMTERFSANQSLTNQTMPAMQTESSQHPRSFRLSRMLERSASFTSLSSALNSAMDSAERLFQDLQASIHSYHRGRNNQQSSSDVDRDSFLSIAATVQQGSQILHDAVDTDPQVVQSASSSRNSDVANVQLDNQSMNTVVGSNNVSPISSSSRGRAELSRISEVFSGIEVNSTAPHSSSSRRRSEAPGDSDNYPYRDPRRRRLM